ncbi:MAG: phage portal protein [Bacilli bacterium]|nr:phage portal protein [Bacilli bacterium]
MSENSNEETILENESDAVNATIPTDVPIVKFGPEEARLFGRKIIYADYLPDEMNELTISKILNDVFYIHLHNSNEIDYLEKYYKGYQPIIGKVKDIRPNINNIVVENNAYFVTEFKKSYVFGEPIQYVQRGDVANEEVSALNSYMLSEDKYPKDTELAESLYVSGIAHRLVLPNINEDSPFEIDNLDSKYTFIVYSSYLPHEKLFGCTYTKGVKDSSIKGSIYTKNAYFTFNTNHFANSFVVEFKQWHILGDIPIFEYYLNKSRLGIIEVIMDILNQLNRVTSDEIDGLEQYVQSLLVFVNQDIDKEDFEGLLDLGAIKIATGDPSRPADLKLLSNNIDHSNTKVLHDRLFNAALNIVGIPKNSDKASGGDTGQARLLGEGWTMADERAKQDEMAFKRCSKPELNLILKICKLAPKSLIKLLTPKDVEIKFTRNKSDNFLVKSQGLMNQIQSGISPDVAMTTSGLYSDTNEAFNKSMEFYGGVENWVKLFIEKANKQLNQNQKENDSDV